MLDLDTPNTAGTRQSPTFDNGNTEDDEIENDIVSLENIEKVDCEKVQDTEKQVDESPRQLEPPPDGGFEAWLQISGSFFLFFNSWGISNTFGVFESYYVSIDLSHKTPSQIAWIGSIQSFLLLLFGVITGPLFDRGYLRYLIIVGSFMVVLGMMMLSLCTEYYQVILSQAVLIGLGSGCLFIPSVALIPQYFSSHRSLATGIAASGGSIGGIVYPLVFHSLQPKIGFPWSTRIIGFIMFATLIYATLIMRPRLPHSKHARKLIDLSALRDPAFMSFMGLAVLGFMGIYVPFYYMASYAYKHGILSENTSFYTLIILNGASIFGRIIPNFSADIVGPVNILIPFSFLTAIVGYCWLAANSVSGVVLICIFYGFFSGTFVSLPPACLTSLSPDIRILGTRMGMAFFFASLGLLVGTPVAGALLEHNGFSFTHTIIFSATIVVAAGVMAVFTRVFKVGFNLRVKI
ncbi:major facilitator superfamily domain-containing protein [Lipomyces oligophaga]|uniref:major facilitator superfamily domain-containing protein n=1 Tax=Lipomyces oligophaga TaxID=45792 RepID=UPI0034CED6DD